MGYFINWVNIMTTYNRFQGDLAIKLTPDGADIPFIGGQPVMDQGLENVVTISLFTKPGWWGNDLEIEENKKIGSNYERERIAIDIQTINDVVDDANLALDGMRKNLVSKLDITATNPRSNEIKTAIKIYPPGKDAEELLFLSNGTNWINQAQNPAHERYE
jgi:phage gp46-like protein